MNESANPLAPEKPVPQRRRSIRVWRDEAQPLTDRMVAFPDRYASVSLRKERALSGRIGYDLNRHIRLNRQKIRVGVKQKTPSLEEGVSL